MLPTLQLETQAGRAKLQKRATQRLQKTRWAQTTPTLARLRLRLAVLLQQAHPLAVQAGSLKMEMQPARRGQDWRAPTEQAFPRWMLLAHPAPANSGDLPPVWQLTIRTATSPKQALVSAEGAFSEEDAFRS